MAQDPRSFLMGSGIPGFSFLRPGDTIRGKITGEPTLQQQKVFNTNDPAFWPSGDPKMQMLVPVSTEFRNYEGISTPDRAVPDTGDRMIYVKGKHMESAMRIAIRTAGAGFLDVDGFIEIMYTGDDMESKAGSKPKLFAVRYTPPNPAAAAFMNQGGQGYQQAGFAPQQPAQPVYAPQQAYNQAPVQQGGWPPAIQQPAHHSQGPLPDWAQPAPSQPLPQAAPVSAAPVSATPTARPMNTLDMLKAAQSANPSVQTDDIQPAF